MSITTHWSFGVGIVVYAADQSRSAKLQALKSIPFEQI
mgnify:CR=1 FL=1